MQLAFRRVGSVLAWLVIVVAVGLITVMVLVPRLGGATPYTVLTGSMRPDYPPGTLVVIKPRPADEIGIGDVITYQLKSNKPEVVTHLVVAMGADPKTGEPIFQTQGIANDSPDPGWVRPVQVRGVLWYSLPALGWVNNWMTGQKHQILVWVVAALLIGYACWAFAGSALDARRRRAQETEA